MNRSMEPEADDDGLAGGVLDWLGGIADAASDAVRKRVEGAAQHASRLVHEELERLEARLRRAAILAGALLAGVALTVVGVAGALGEAFGRPWLGQVVAGLGVIVLVAAWFAWSARAQRRRAAAQAAERAAAQPGLTSIAAAGVAGWIAGQFLAPRRR